MPVLQIYFSRFQRMTGLSRETIVDRLPFLGLDIESEDSDSIRIEYNPNRADFSTDYGIARALRGLVGTEVGPPEYRVGRGTISVRVGSNLAKIRPYIACAAAKGLKMDDETIRQLISMQEDLHNGIARKRKKAAIGLHNLDAVKPPLTYAGVSASFEFVPLGSNKKMSVEQILGETETGVQYGQILSNASAYPILSDSAGMVLSFPPIINGNVTKVDTSTRNILVDVTSTDQRIGDDALAIICAALVDAGAAIESVRVEYPDVEKATPDLAPTRMKFNRELATSMIGLDLDLSEMSRCLGRSRLGLDKEGNAIVPRYRVDIIHPVDLVEEVVIGYGLDRIEPLYPPSKEPGSLNRGNVALDRVSESVSMSGFIETMNFDLVDVASLYTKFSRSPDSKIEVENPRTVEHSVLRDSILPSLMAALSRNVQATYPQKVYEVGRVFLREGPKIVEKPRLSALTAHSSCSFSEAKMYLEALVSAHLGESIQTRPAVHWAFAEGRSAEVLVKGQSIGYIGEVKPSALAAFGLDVPVAGYEIDLKLFL
ncbi:MAG: phenylalanine--tRNA ligase subunit beta [Thaumarchaeota archaeon]|nr:phenylalanine--tRNA ligase subunit beta [Nitrososphaerota archaeon]